MSDVETGLEVLTHLQRDKKVSHERKQSDLIYYPQIYLQGEVRPCIKGTIVLQVPAIISKPDNKSIDFIKKELKFP